MVRIVIDYGLIRISKSALKSDLTVMQEVIIRALMMKMANYILHDAENIIAKIKRDIK